MTVPEVPFLEAVQDVSAGNTKIPQSAFLDVGSLAVVDQGQSLVAGYTNAVDAAVKATSPVIVFGDHTRALKFVNFSFAMGADGVKVLRVRDDFDPKFVYRFLESRPIPSAGYSRHFKFLKEVQIPKPPLDEQRRIAAILDHADALRAKRRQVLTHLDTLTQSIFHEMFGDASAFKTSPLFELAQVSSGITKGRRTLDPTTSTPYLAVSNVQAGRLAMDVVKTIDATAAEITRYALQKGDLVLTEGGDPDKLGRGTVWRNELPLCLHQNHIFRVRLNDAAEVLPDYLSAYMATREARSYFLRSAKQTTGIASVNMTQLKALPVAVPPLVSQETYLQRTRRVGGQRLAMHRVLSTSEDLFTSLQARAFRGEL